MKAGALSGIPIISFSIGVLRTVRPVTVFAWAPPLAGSLSPVRSSGHPAASNSKSLPGNFSVVHFLSGNYQNRFIKFTLS